MYLNLKERYWWYGLKRDVAEYVALCDTCQRGKWEEVGMDFIIGLHTSYQSKPTTMGQG